MSRTRIPVVTVTPEQVDAFLDAKEALKRAQEALAEAEGPITAALVANRSLEAVSASDGRSFKVVRPTSRKFNLELLKSLLSRSIWKTVTTEVVSIPAVDAQVKLGHIDATVIAAAITVEDSKPYIKL
jgi:hypothetical protein